MALKDGLGDLRTGKIDLSVHLSRLCDRIEEKEPDIMALVSGTYDRRRILQEAASLLHRYPEQSGRPPLFGLAVGVKDIIRVEGFPTRCGSELPGELFDGAEAECVGRLKRAGAVVVAKTVTTEFAFNEPGPTRNPHRLDHTPGGSSSGSAAGVAAGFFPLALGSQTVGSVIRPAAYCGVAGFKPSHGRISIEGVIPYSVTVDHVGLLCQDVSGIDPVMSVICDDWRASDHKASLKTIVLGIPEGPYLDRTAPNGRDFFDKTVRRLETAGCRIARIPLFDDFGDIETHHRRLIAAEMARYHSSWFERHRDLYRPRTREQIETGLTISDDQIEALKTARLELRETIERKTAAEELTAWICPAATDHAPKGLESTGNAVMNLPWTASGHPVVTVPAGKDAAGLPHGIQLVGRFGKDEALIPVAGALYETLSG